MFEERNEVVELSNEELNSLLKEIEEETQEDNKMSKNIDVMKIMATEVNNEVENNKIDKFVNPTFSSENAFKRFQALKKAEKIVSDTIIETCGIMPDETRDVYESWEDILKSLKYMESVTIREGK